MDTWSAIKTTRFRATLGWWSAGALFAVSLACFFAGGTWLLRWGAGLFFLCSGAAAVAAAVYLPKLGLGRNAHLEISVSITEMSFGLCEVAIDDAESLWQLVDQCLPLPLRLHEIQAQELTLALRPWARCFALRTAGLQLSLAMVHPTKWHRRGDFLALADAAAEAAVNATLAALAVADMPKGPPPSGLLVRLIDAVINCASIEVENFDFSLEASRNYLCTELVAQQAEVGSKLTAIFGKIQAGDVVSPDHFRKIEEHNLLQMLLDGGFIREANRECGSGPPGALGLRVLKLELSPAHTATAWILSETSELGYGAWSRNIVADGLALAVRPSGTELCRGFSSGEGDLLLPIDHCEIRVLAPAVWRGLLSGHRDSVRRIEVKVDIQGSITRTSLDKSKMGTLQGILGEYSNASAWQASLLAKALCSGRPVEEYEERVQVVYEFCVARKEKRPIVRNGILCSEYLALRRWAERGIESLDIHDDETWSVGVKRFKANADEIETNVQKEQSLFHELAIAWEIREWRIDLGSGAAQIQSSGVSGSVDLLPDLTEIKLSIRKETTVCARALTLIHCSSQHVQPSTPFLDATLSLPSVGPMEVKAETRHSTIWTDIAAILNTLKPELSNLSYSDDVPPAPSVGKAASPPEIAQDPEPSVGYLSGMALNVDLTCTDAKVIFPSQPSKDRCDRGIRTYTEGLTASLRSGADGENLTFENLTLILNQPSISVLGEQYILQPLDVVNLSYELTWNHVESGYLQRVVLGSPFAKLSVSPRVLKVADRACQVLTNGLAETDGTEVQAEDVSTEDDSTKSKLKERVLALFNEIDEDKSGKLDRREIFAHVGKLCVGENALTHAELEAEFESFWAAADVSGDEKIDFEEFYSAFSSYFISEQLHQTGGSIRLVAGDLCCQKEAAHIGDSKERLYDSLRLLLPTDCVLPNCSEEEQDELVLDLQWKLLRTLRNWDAARHWWDKTVGPLSAKTVGPLSAQNAKWRIAEDAAFRSATDVMTDALSGHFQKVAVNTASDSETKKEERKQQRQGCEIVLKVVGFEVGFADALSQLRGVNMICIHAGHSEDVGEALSMALTCWNDAQGSMFGENATVDGHLKLRDFYGTCVNPFDKTPRDFIEKWGVYAQVHAKCGEQHVTFRMASDQHFIFNMTSSVCLAMQPILAAMLPAVKNADLEPILSADRMSSTPLDHCLRMLGELSKDDLVGFSLIPSGASHAGFAEVGKESLEDSATLEQQKRHFHARSIVPAEFRIPLNRVITRVVPAEGWEVTHLRLRDGALRVQLGHSTTSPPRDPSVQIFTQRRVQSSSPPCRVMERRSAHFRHGQLTIRNRSGLKGKFWFDGEPQSEAKDLLTDEDNVCNFTNSNSALCLAVDEDVMRPNVTTVGSYGAPLPQIGMPVCRQESLFDVQTAVSHVRSVANTLVGVHRAQSALDDGSMCLCIETSVDRRGALLQLLPPLELRNATQQPLIVELLALSNRSDVSPSAKEPPTILGPGQDYQVPCYALDRKGWMIRTYGTVSDSFVHSVSHSFVLSGSLFQLGSKEAAARKKLGLTLQSHTLEPLQTERPHHRQSLGSNSPDQRQFRRHTLLLLPGLRIANACPLTISCSMRRKDPAHDRKPDAATKGVLNEKHVMKPGGAVDFGLCNSGFVLTLEFENINAFENNGRVEVQVDSDVMQSAKNVRAFSRDLQTQGSNMTFSLQCTWSAGSGPEFVIYGQYLVYNKTGLGIQVRSHKLQSAYSKVEQVSIVRAHDHQLEVAVTNRVDEQAFEMPKLCGNLQLWCWNHLAHLTGDASSSSWVDCSATLQDGALNLRRDKDGEINWVLSEYSKAAESEVFAGVSEPHTFTLEERNSHTLKLKAPCVEEFQAWLQRLKQTVDAWRVRAAKLKEMPNDWGGDQGGRCCKSGFPISICDLWSAPLPVQAPVEGEVRIDMQNAVVPSAFFLGIQIRPLLAALSRSKSVTFTPRFIIQNRTSMFIQTLPAILPPRSIPVAPWHASLAIAKSRSGKSSKADLDAGAKEEADAVWVPPGESAILYNFPLHKDCNNIAHNGRPAVSLRLSGRAPLEVIKADRGEAVPLDLVGRSFLPYSDESKYHFGALPTCLRRPAESGRLRCLVGPCMSEKNWGELILTTAADVFVVVWPNVKAAPWLHSQNWENLGSLLSLKKDGEVQTLHLWRKHLEAGRVCFDGAGAGTIICFASSHSKWAEIGNRSGLPWSPWMCLDTTGDELCTLENEDGVAGNDKHFIKCSVQMQSSTAFLVLSETPAPFCIQNWSPSRTLAIEFQGNKDRKRHVLAPMSWWSFTWPGAVSSEGKRQVNVQDIGTGKRKIYDINGHGFSETLVLSDKQQDCTGEHAPMTQEGYRALCELNDIDGDEMGKFLQRVGEDLMKQTRRDSRGLKMPAIEDFKKFYSEHRDTQELQTLRSSMFWDGLLTLPTLKAFELTEEDFHRSKACVATMVKFLDVLLESGGLLARSQEDMEAFASDVCHHADMERMLEDICSGLCSEPPWIYSEGKVVECYKTAASKCNVLSIYICLWREIFEHPVAVNSTTRTAVKRVADDIRKEFTTRKVRCWDDVRTDVRENKGNRQLEPAIPSSPSAATVVASEIGDDESFSRSPRRRCDTGGTEAPAMDLAHAESLSAHASFSVASEALVVGLSETLTDEGYSNVLKSKLPRAVSSFVRRVISDQALEVLDVQAFHTFCGHLGDEHSKLQSLKDQLRNVDWVQARDTTGSASLYSFRYHDGATKVLALSDGTPHEGFTSLSNRRLQERQSGKGKGIVVGGAPLKWCDIDIQMAGLHVCCIYDPRVQALGTGVNVARRDQEELFTITADHFRVRKEFEMEKIEITLHHFQIDNMKAEHSHNPIILAPQDSGYNITRREKPLKKQYRELQPLFKIAVEIVPSGILHIQSLEFLLQPVHLRVDGAFWMDIGTILSAWISKWSSVSAGEETEVTVQYAEELVASGISVPTSASTNTVVFLNLVHIGAIVFDVEFLMPRRDRLVTIKETDAFEDDEQSEWISREQSAWLSTLTYQLKGKTGPKAVLRNILISTQGAIGWIMQSVGEGVLSGVGHITPRIAFNNCLLENEFGDLDPIISRVVRQYGKQGALQVWRVLFSTNIIGDPVGLGSSMFGGVKQFFIKTGNEIVTGDLKGEGVKSLVQGVVGGAAGATGKLLGAWGDALDGVTQSGGGVSVDDSIHHVGDGVKEGGKVVLRSVARGAMRWGERSKVGLKNEGVVGLGKEFAKGGLGFLGGTASGLLHGAQAIAEGIDATTHLGDRLRQLAPRRIPRSLSQGFTPLTGLEFSPKITVCIEKLNLDCISLLRGNTYTIEVLVPEAPEAGRRVSKCGKMTRAGIWFRETHWFRTEHVLKHHIIFQVRDRTLCPGANGYNDLGVVYRGQVSLMENNDTDSPVSRLAQLIQCPPQHDLKVRHRPQQPMKIQLDSWRPDGTPRHTPVEPVELLVRFWLAWDPESVPSYQQFKEPPNVSSELVPNDALQLPPPPSYEGWLDKHAKGMMNHWSAKWVQIKDRQFKYWDKKEYFDRGDEPKARHDLTRADWPHVFAAGAEIDSCFVEVHRKTQTIEARWRPSRTHSGSPSRRAPNTAGDWLGKIFEHSMTG